MYEAKVKKSQEQMYGAFGGAKYLLAGPTGSGKTTFVSKLVNPKAVPLINQMVGQGSSTLKPKTFVLSGDEDFKNIIRVCAKPHSQPMNRQDYDDVIVETFSLLAKQASKENVKRVETAEHLLTKGFIKGENHVSFLGLLKEQAVQWIAGTSDIIETVEREELRNLYDIARGRLDDLESAKTKNKNSESIDTKLAEVFRDYLDGTLHNFSGKEVGRQLALQYNAINDLFLKHANEFFGSSELTKDGYLTIDFPLDAPLDEKLDEKRNSFFCNNSNENEISIEVLYEEIVVYVGINLRIVNLLGQVSEQFKNRNGNMEFGLIDTMGAFHRYGDKSEAQNYFAKLAREHEYDGVILLTPLYLGANEKKFLRLSSDFFRQFPFNLDVIIISNKVDMVIDQYKKEWESKHSTNDPFAMEESEEVIEVDSDMLKGHLVNTMKLIEQEVVANIKEQGNGRVNVLAHLATSFVENKIDTFGVKQLKSLSQTVLEMIRCFAQAKNTVEKIVLEFNPDYGSDIGMSINTLELDKEMLTVLDPVMFTDVMSNYQANLRKIPHGQSFNALPSRLSYGEGYKVELDKRFINVHSFDIAFPDTIRNSLKNRESNLVSVLRNCITFEGVRNLTPDVEEALFTRLTSHLVIRNITASLVYTQTFRPIMKQPHYSFGTKFQSYLENVKTALTNPNNRNSYTKAIEEEVHRAFKSMLDSDVLYRK